MFFSRISSFVLRNPVLRRNVFSRSFSTAKTNQKLGSPFLQKLVVGGGLLVGLSFMTHSMISKCELALYSESVERFKEPSSNVEVSKRICYGENEKDCHDLIGIGVRKVTFLKIQAYALALYLPSKTIAEIKKRWKGKEINEANSQKMLDDILQINGDFTLRMVPVRQVAANHLYMGFIAPINKKLEKQHTESGKVAEGDSTIKTEGEKEFQTLLPAHTILEKGTLIDFVKTQNKLHIFVNGEHKGKINDEVFSKLFFEVVLGEGSKIEDPKKEFAKGLQQLVK
eukprot:TRINITY_DN3183_c0_g1_i1.p1 TRINITY_DN3183_c0_g1~~TRINITY_DN3183_c0_g1_i1.p1  ORF type:complete len:284 (-),score=68.34 TRINITY_DN3183_c0_g1_i1:71-922(-)